VLRNFATWVSVFMVTCAGYGITVPASEDSTGYLNALTKAAGTSSVLTVDASRISFFYFDLNDIPSDAVLRWAKLRLYLPVVRTPGAGLGVHLVTSEWNEALASAQPSISAGTVGVIGPEKIASKRFVTVDVTPTVQGWISGRTPNEGFAIKPLSAGTAGVTSLHLPSKEGIFFGLPAELDLDFKSDFAELPDSIQRFFTPSFTTAPNVSFTERTLSAGVSGVGQLSCQWYRNGVALAGGTSATLPLTGLASGAYTLRVSNGIATVVTSSPVQYDAASIGPFVSIAAGKYERGNVLNEGDIYDAPVQVVTLSRYFMAAHDTTKAQWDEVWNWAKSHEYLDLPAGEGRAANHPVVSVNWYDVVKWANAASEKDGLVPCYTLNQAVYRTGNSDDVICNWASNGYRLPTEAEWEVAARGGLIGKRFPLGDTISHSQANYAANGHYFYDLSRDWNDYHPAYKIGDFPYTSPVGSFGANKYGLYDMGGNVCQWCWDWEGRYVEGSDPRGPSSGYFRIVRGGSWRMGFNPGDMGGAARARVALRGSDDADRGPQDYGFRLVKGSP
jgi:formylglycine-generating enzyme required for sulfatase activity